MYQNATCSEQNDKLPIRRFLGFKKGLDFSEKASGGKLSAFTWKSENRYPDCLTICKGTFMPYFKYKNTLTHT